MLRATRVRRSATTERDPDAGNGIGESPRNGSRRLAVGPRHGVDHGCPGVRPTRRGHPVGDREIGPKVEDGESGLYSI